MVNMLEHRYLLRTKSLSKLTIYVFLFFFIFMPYLFGSYNPLHVLAFLSWISLIAFILFSENKSIIIMRFIQRLFPLVFLLFFTCIYVGIVVVVNNHTEELIETMYRFIVVLTEIIPISLFISISFAQLRLDFKDLLNAFITIALVQSVLALAMIISPSVRDALFGIMKGNGLDLKQFGFLSYRAYGIANCYTFAMPIFQCVVALFALYMAVRGSPKYYVASAIILFSAVINARISLFLFAFGSSIILAFFVRERKRKILKVLFSLVVVILSIWLSLDLLATVLPITSIWLEKSIEEVRLFFFEGTREGYFLALEQMIHFPSGVELVFGVGDSPFGGGMYGLAPNSDVGYIIDTYIGGISLIAMLGMFVLSLSAKAIKFCKGFKEVIILFTLILAVANIKGCAFGPKEFFNAYILICVFAVSLGTAKTGCSGQMPSGKEFES